MPSSADAAAGAAPPSVNPRYPLLDSMRGLAALSVFGAHVVVYLFPIAGDDLGPLLTRLDPGIAIFLLLSAFLLYRPFVKARYRGTRRPAIVPFAIRRALRILPVYWTALPIVALWFGLAYVFTPEGIVTYFGFLQVYDTETITGGIGQAWTICVEITFYLMLPLWAVMVRKVIFRSVRGFVASELVFLGVIFVASVLWKLLAFDLTPSAPGLGPAKLTPTLFTLPAYLDAFAVGMALAVISVVLADRERQPRCVRLVDRRPWLAWVGAAVAYWASGIGGGTTEVDSSAFYVLHQELNTAVAVGLFLPAILGDPRRGWLRRLLARRSLVWMGTISYGFYLWHLAVMAQFASLGWLDGGVGALAFVAASFAVTVALGALSYYGIGRYFLRLGERLPREVASGPVVSASGADRTVPSDR